MPADLFKLSFTVQLAVASGYLAYLIAYAGIRQHHTAADAILKSFAFGAAASAMMTYGYASRWTPVVSFALPIALGVCWRWFGMRWWQAIVREAGISWADDIPSAWLSVTATRTDFSPSQITVETMDGRLLFCEDTRPFADCHEGPVSFGLTGDIAFYVTAELPAAGRDWIEKEDVRHGGEGDLITYLPASQIKRVELRYLSAKAAKAVAKRGEPAAAAGASEAEQSPV